MIPLSILDLSSIVEGGDASEALANTLDLARHVERLAGPYVDSSASIGQKQTPAGSGRPG